MKALTICQPYAHLICATKQKAVENRDWATHWRGPLLIHAGKSRDWLMLDEADPDIDQTYGIRLSDMAFGAVIGAVTLVDCLHIDRIRAGEYDHRFPWLREHEHASGPWCWILTNRVAFHDPVPWRGERKLFEIPDREVQAQIDLIKADFGRATA